MQLTTVETSVKINQTPRLAAESDPLNNWVLEFGQDIAAQLGLPELPMSNPNFDFVGYARAVMKKMGFTGFTLEEKAHETIQRLMFNINTGDPGPMASYDGSTPYDSFFKMAVQRRGLSEARDEGRKRRDLPTTSIKPSGKDEDSPGVSQEVLPGVDSDSALGLNDEYMDSTIENVMRFLEFQRHGDFLAMIFRMMIPEPHGQGMNQTEITKALNNSGVVSPSGATKWSPGMVNKYIQTIRGLFSKYAIEEDKGEGGEGTLKPLMDNLAKSKTKPPKQLGGTFVWLPDGDPDKATEVEIIRRGQKNTSFRLPDGTVEKAKSEHVVPRG